MNVIQARTLDSLLSEWNIGPFAQKFIEWVGPCPNSLSIAKARIVKRIEELAAIDYDKGDLLIESKN